MTDVCNAGGYDKQLWGRAISLILFFDAAHFSNATDGKVWAVLAMILNFPLVIRGAFYNVIPIIFWQGHVFNNFNNIFKHHLSELVQILQNGINVQIGATSVHLQFYIHILIGDTPAIPKIACCKQFNGFFGCLKCMNSGYTFKKNTHVYAYSRAKKRTSKIYTFQVKKAQIGKRKSRQIAKDGFEGIKGKCWFSKFCILPDAVAIDFMHLLGLVKQILASLFDSTNSKAQPPRVYLGKLISHYFFLF